MFPTRVLIKHKFKMTGDCYVFKFLQRPMWAENDLMHFQSETSVVFKFLLRSMDGAYNYMRRENDLHYSTFLLQDNQSSKRWNKIKTKAIPQLDQMHRACHFARYLYY